MRLPKRFETVLKRYLIFIALALTLFAVNAILPQIFPGLKPQPVAQKEDDKKESKKADDKKQPGEKKEQSGEKKSDPGESQDPAEKETEQPAENTEKTEDPADQSSVENATEESDASEEEPAPKKEATFPENWVTLGSVDPSDSNPYRMLVTLTSRGAAIRRLELSNPQYLDLDDRSGYLGHLSTKTADAKLGDGLLVQVVGPGTPAAEAGMQAGDILQKLNGEALKNSTQLRLALSRTKPRQKVDLQVLRDGKQLSLTAKLRRLPLAVMRPEIENLRIRDVEVPPGFEDPPSLLLTLGELNDQEREKEQQELPGVSLRRSDWELIEPTPAEIKQNPGTVWQSAAFKQTLPSGLEIIKRYSLVKVDEKNLQDTSFPAYDLKFDIEFKNTADDDQELTYELDGPTGLPVEGWWYGNKIGRGGAVGVRDMVGQWFESDTVMFGAETIADDEQDTISDISMMYAGVDAQYFSAVLIPRKENVEEIWFEKVRGLLISPEIEESAKKRLANITVRMNSHPVKLAGQGNENSSVTHSFTLFAGPKKPNLLAQYGQPADPTYNLSELVYYGWPIWGAVARVMTTILHAFYSIVQNYGIAIIMLTVLVRGCMFPLSRKQALNMVKMQELKPEMDRIQAKYKNEMDKRSKAMQELFRKNNYNPMGGCVLMVLQLPIFLGLYRALMIDVELRQAPLFSDAIRFCSNLAGPDMLFDWSAWMPEWVNQGEGFFGLGPYFNILPIITVCLFLFQQKMFMPPATDETSAMQQKMMKYMMVFMGFMFYKVASGLCLYFIASTSWGMAERKFLPKSKPVDKTDTSVPVTPEKKSASSSENGASSRNKKKKSKRR